MKTLAEKIEVMQAALDGKEIEVRNYPHETNHQWADIDKKEIVWNWPNVDYRIKQEPMEFWVNTFNGRASTCWQTKEEAEAVDQPNMKTIKVREVTDEE